MLTGRFATVTTVFAGASAARVEALVTEKIENALGEIEEIDEIESTSRTGISVVVIELEDAVVNVDEVWSRVRDRLVDAEAELPAAAQSPEFERQNTTAFTFLVGLTWTLDEQPHIDLLQRLARDFEQRLAPPPGTKETEIFGAPEEEMSVTLDPMVMASVNLTAADGGRCGRPSLISLAFPRIFSIVRTAAAARRCPVS